MGLSKQEKRRAERQREREEETRQHAEERRAEAERDKANDEERRQESIRAARELDVALEAAQRRGAAARELSRRRRKQERQITASGVAHRAAILETLRALNQQERQTEAKRGERARSAKQTLADSSHERESAESVVRERADDRRRESLAGKQAASAAVRRGQDARRDAARERPKPDAPAKAPLERQRRAKQQEPGTGRDDAGARPRREPERTPPDRAPPDRSKTDGARAERVAERRRDAKFNAAQERRRAENAARTAEADQRAARITARQEESRAARRNESAARAAEAEQRAAQIAVYQEESRAAKRAESAAAERAAAATAERQSERHAAAQEGRRDVTAAGLAATRAAAGSAEREASAGRAPDTQPLRAHIASGALSGDLPWLRVNGRRLVDLDGAPVLLRGVNLEGMDATPPDPEAGYAAAAGVTEDVIDGIIGWGANVIRVAINRDWVLHGHDEAADFAYVAELDRIVERASAGGAYTLLSLRRLDVVTSFGTRRERDGTTVTNFIAPQPDYDSIGMWRLLGERYADEPAVLFDLYAAPHRALSDDLSGYDTRWDLWSVWVRLMLADLRRMHPRSLCFVAGLDWGTDLSGFPVRGTAGEPIPNLVYAARVLQGSAAPWVALDALARHHPVFVTEWSGAAAETLWGEQVAMRLRAGGFGWAASDWKALQPSAGGPSKLGAVVRRALALAEQQPRERLVPRAQPAL
jgi:hypothetical protein